MRQQLPQIRQQQQTPMLQQPQQQTPMLQQPQQQQAAMLQQGSQQELWQPQMQQPPPVQRQMLQAQQRGCVRTGAGVQGDIAAAANVNLPGKRPVASLKPAR
jgi:hypothetical protein